ncbi:N-acetylglucosamine-6-phosphate deacetylase [Salipiger abyssi]|uniref:N-acetylglucosamine-6-phosphate deacetylase n=1 Tax=Salipiger abyssi TaxID=1250539 RepID=UPI001A8C2903|nr:N-acetylglucosamine-6-phosphate deacetylase [Salipiger abyssi]MBN9888682.1 N-acetylglucosamine-6-phosphate deacetylase [Salipiger abyssi]
MTGPLIALVGADILQPGGRLSGHALLIRGDRIAAIVPEADLPGEAIVTRLDGGLLTPGFVDLQVNGGGGVMLNNSTDAGALATMARAHAAIGATSILPTLITDTAEQVARAIAAVAEALAAGTPGILGLHLEGPHLALSRKGAHDPALIRPMEEADLEMLCAAAARLPLLMLTVAPESVTPAQIRRLVAAGALVSLGHTDATYETCLEAIAAGARVVTHLFNAQSQMTGRAPGVVGTALARGELSAGLIADGIHVSAASMGIALRAKRGPGRIFLVSDAMATAGSDVPGFTLNGRRILRDGDRLALEDGTLAGAHLPLATAIRNLVGLCEVPLCEAAAMATEVPAGLAGATGRGRLCAGYCADVLHLSDEIALRRVWQGGKEVVAL